MFGRVPATSLATQVLIAPNRWITVMAAESRLISKLYLKRGLIITVLASLLRVSTFRTLPRDRAATLNLHA